MTYLDCTVTGCIYNAEESCNKGEIMVAGREAKDNSGTCCASFRERKSNGGSNDFKRVSKEARIACEAHHCRFNEANECYAKHIGIAGGNACACGETECASFECNC